MAALTLADMYLMSPYMLEQGIIKTLQEESQLIDTLSFENIQAMTVQTYRSGKLNPVGWRKINEPFGSVIQGKPEPVSAGIFSFGNMIDVDYLVRDDKTPKIVEPMTQQVDDTTQGGGLDDVVKDLRRKMGMDVEEEPVRETSRKSTRTQPVEEEETAPQGGIDLGSLGGLGGILSILLGKGLNLGNIGEIAKGVLKTIGLAGGSMK